jgi:small basic protein (TIGR04137 family)
MSIHKSLKVRTKLARARNVFTRAERIEKLKKQGHWDEEKSVFGLPKVKAQVVKKVGKKKKKTKEEAK